ncbi:MAG TPA: hypothetical protein VFK02_07185 [Kofleriaceae bacterium]|nr:hypothetical protein [Kofleriaceae bacterium]
MRCRSAIVLVTVLAGSSVGCGTPAPDTARDLPDAQPMRPAEDAAVVPPPNGFQIVGPSVDVAAHEDATYCYYFHAPNSSDLLIRKWASRSTTGVHDIALYATPKDLQRPGTLSADGCGFFANGLGPVWMYSADDLINEVELPADDGTGVPVGQPVAPGQSMFLLMHFVNSTAAPVRAHVELDAYAYDDTLSVTLAGSFYTWSDKINLQPGSATSPTTGMVTGSCDVAANAKFYLLSTRTHKQGVHTMVTDAATTVFDSTSWEHPGKASWPKTPFYTFASGKLTYQCEYVNPNNYQIVSGDDATRQETCIAVGYYFPAPGGIGAFCLDSTVY